MDTSLKDADASFYGEHAQDHAGWSVAAAGDVNGDGFADILIGAPGVTVSTGQVGRVYLILGKASGWSTGTSLSQADASYYGEGAADGFGSEVASAGDVDGDGFDEIIMSSPLCDEGFPDSGKTYVVRGKNSGWTTNIPATNADAVFTGEAEDDQCGDAIGPAGDTNGDGFADILIGAPYNDDGADGAGKAYLFFGNNAFSGSKSTVLFPDVTFTGELTNDNLGGSVASAGDVNGDGCDDILIGAQGFQSVKGKTYLVLGKHTGWVADADIASAMNASFVGESDYDSSGSSLASGDVNNDGARDILIGAERNDENGLDAGQVYLFLNDSEQAWNCLAYDTSGNDEIDFHEMVMALMDYLASQLTFSQMVDILMCYLTG